MWARGLKQNDGVDGRGSKTGEEGKRCSGGAVISAPALIEQPAYSSPSFLINILIYENIYESDDISLPFVYCRLLKKKFNYIYEPESEREPYQQSNRYSQKYE